MVMEKLEKELEEVKLVNNNEEKKQNEEKKSIPGEILAKVVKFSTTISNMVK